MTEESIREVFFKNYSGNNLEEALIESIEQISLALVADAVEQSESLLNIVKTIIAARSRAILFGGMTDGTKPVVPVIYLTYFDQVLKAVIDAARYARDNHEVMDPWFRERFEREELGEISTLMASRIEESAERPGNERLFTSGELMLYVNFLTAVLLGVIGMERFQKFTEKYNKYAMVLRQCQVECKTMDDPTFLTKES